MSKTKGGSISKKGAVIRKSHKYEEEKMRKVVLFAMMVFIILLSCASFAQENEVKEISLEESVQIALKNNLDLKMAAYDLSLKEIEYEEAKINNLLKASIINLESAKLSLKRAKDSFEERRKKLLEEVTNWYYQILKSEQKVQIEKISVEEAKENLEMVKNRFSLGDANQLEVMQAEITLSSAQLNLTRAENELRLAKMNFNQVLGVPLETQFKLTDTFSLEILEVTLEDSIQKALENRYEITQAQDEIELARLKWELTQNEYTAELSKKKAIIELEKEKLNLEEVKKEIILEITQSFLDLKEKETNIEITIKQEQEKEETYRIAQEQYKAGFITTADLLDSQIQFIQAKVNALEALFNYNLTKKQFVRALGTELEETPETPQVSARKQ
jgi:outer membrane protein TolC